MHGVSMVRSACDGVVCHRYNLYDQADKLVSKSSFPEQASNNQLARYLCAVAVSSVAVRFAAATAGCDRPRTDVRSLVGTI